MKRLFPAAAFVALLCVGGPARAADQNALLVRSTDVYTGPGKYPILTRLIRGAQVKVLACNTIQAWCEVGSGKTRGWVSASALELMSKGKRSGEKAK